MVPKSLALTGAFPANAFLPYFSHIQAGRYRATQGRAGSGKLSPRRCDTLATGKWRVGLARKGFGFIQAGLAAALAWPLLGYRRLQGFAFWRMEGDIPDASTRARRARWYRSLLTDARSTEGWEHAAAGAGRIGIAAAGHNVPVTPLGAPASSGPDPRRPLQGLRLGDISPPARPVSVALFLARSCGDSLRCSALRESPVRAARGRFPRQTARTNAVPSPPVPAAPAATTGQRSGRRGLKRSSGPAGRSAPVEWPYAAPRRVRPARDRYCARRRTFNSLGAGCWPALVAERWAFSFRSRRRPLPNSPRRP